MASLNGPTNETGIPYYLYAADGTYVAFNVPADPNYVGPLSGDEGITGLDSSEIIESFAQKTEDDGALHGNFYLGRRPITMSGAIVPTSAADRATRVHKLKTVLSKLLRADGVLSFTPTGGENVYYNVRCQQPLRIRGKWAKEFFVGLVAADPRAYSTRRFTSYIEDDSSQSGAIFRRFTWASGSGTALATRTVRIPAGTWTVRHWIKSNSAGRTIAQNITPNSALVSTPASLTAGWTEVSQVVTVTAGEGADTTIALNLSVALTSTQYVEIGPTVIESASGNAAGYAAGFASNWSAGSGYTASFVTANPPPGLENQGNADAPVRWRSIGPWNTNGAAVYYGGSMDVVGTAYSSSDFFFLDTATKTIVKNVGGTNDYQILSGFNNWYGMRPGLMLPYVYGGAGLNGHVTGQTRHDVCWRNTYI